MRIGGLDVATSTGFAVINGDKIKAGVFRASSKTDGMILHEFLTWCLQWIRSERIDFIGIEAPLMQVSRDSYETEDSEFFGATKKKKAQTSPKILMRLWSLNITAQACAESLNVPWLHVPVQTHRKSFLGSGRIPSGQGKIKTLEQCRKMGLDIKSKDAADAVSVAWHTAGHCRQQMIRPGDLFE